MSNFCFGTEFTRIFFHDLSLQDLILTQYLEKLLFNLNDQTGELEHKNLVKIEETLKSCQNATVF